MQNFANKMEQALMPVANKLANIKYLIALRDGMVYAMPFFIVGSILLLLLNLPLTDPANFMYSEWYTNLMAEHKGNWLQPFYATLGMSCLFISFGIGSSLGKQYGLPEITSGFLSLFGFLMVAAPVTGWPPAINASYLDSKGIFTAILVSYLAIEVYRFMHFRKMTIRLPEQVPPAIARSFESLTPVIALILVLQPLNLFVASLGEGGMLIPELLMQLFVPLVGAADTLPGLLLIVLLVHILWFCGLHGTNIVVGVITAIMLANLQANQAAMEAGEALPAIFAGGFLDSFVYLGGAGATLGLAIAMSISKSAHLRSIGRLSVVPGLFNINEPVIFGAPVIMNPILGIPFICIPLINVTVAYTLTSMDMIGRVVALVPWTTPGPLAAFLSTNFSVSALVLSLALVAFSTAAYLPFLRIYSKSLEKQEAEAAGEAATA